MSIDIAQMVRQLAHVRKANGLKTALVLGTRTSPLFLSPPFQQTVQAFIPNSSPAAPGRFAQYYRLLCHINSPFSPTEIQAMLSEALSHITPSESDKRLAALIMQEYFDPIITTNADTLLEQALTNAGWRDSHEFQVINLMIEPDIHSFSTGRKPACTIFKVFGELRMRNFLLSGRYAYMNVYQKLANSLAAILRRDCLMVGIDDIWDAALFQVVPAQGDSCWIVTEEEPDARSPFYSLKETRSTRFFIDNSRAQYQQFFVALHHALMGSSTAISPHGEITSSQQGKHQREHKMTEVHIEQLSSHEKLNAPAPVEIFISYHHKDEFYLNKLVSHLATLQNEHIVNKWFKRNIAAGQSISEEMYHHLNNADIVLLMVSDDFLAAEDLYRGEVQQAIAQYQQGRACVIPILIRPVDWRDTVFGDLEPLPSNHCFVKQWRDIDGAFLDIVQGIKRVIALRKTIAPN